MTMDSLPWRRVGGWLGGLLVAMWLLIAPAVGAPPLSGIKASAGLLKIGPDPERPDAEIFHVSYTRQGADPARRPVTFVFNGGPGASSIYLHLAALGPKVLVSPGDGRFPAVPARLQDNPDSWLAFTDLVFIDPVDTGYSRMLPGPDGKPADAKRYFEVESDVQSLAGFIRQWLTLNQRWASPKAVAGESYAGQRIAALTRVLAEQHGINLNRAVMLSPAMKVPTLDTTRAYDLLHPMTLLPTQAAVAAHHGLSSISNDAAGYRAAEAFALGDYLIGLASLGRASPEAQQAFYARVGGLIGIDPALVARHRGRVPEVVFAANLLAARGQVLDSYDGTQASDNPTPEKRDDFGAFDRSVVILPGVLLPPFIDYLQRDLGFRTPRPYLVLNLAVSMQWDRRSTLGGPEDLAVALTQNPDLQVLVAHGYHDLGANYFLSRYLLEQVVRSPSARQRLVFHTYQGGHMFYLRSQSRAALTQDVRRFFESSP